MLVWSGEMLIKNMISTVISDLGNVRCSGNWMWATNDDDKNKFMLYDAAQEKFQPF